MKKKKQDSSTRKEQERRAIELYSAGKSQKEIASILGVSEQTIVAWKSKYKNTKLDWDKNQDEKQSTAKTVQQWIEEKIDYFRQRIDDHIMDEEALKPLIDNMDSFISMKKKYEATIDTFGESLRVMETFGIFVKEHYPDMVSEIEEIMSAYLRTLAK